MSLIAWYPLDGDIKDYSGNLNDLIYENNSGRITSDPLGKIGSCYKRTLNGSGDALRATEMINLLGKSFTMCCWVNVTSIHSGTANGLVTNHSHSTNSGAGITIKDVSASDFRISCNTGTGSARTFNTYYGTSNIKDKWSHLILRFDNKDNNLSLWVNGVKEYEGTYAMSSPINYLDIFNWSTTHIMNSDYRPACKINDVRIYDEAISLKEIQEIVKAKILHYTFNTPQEAGVVTDITGYGNDTTLGVGTSPEHIQHDIRDWDIPKINNDFMRQAFNGSTTISTVIVNDYLDFNPTTTGWVGLYSQDKTYENFEISADLNTDSNHVGIGFSNPNSGTQCDGYQWCIRLDISGSSDDSRIQKWSTGSQTYIGSGSGGFSMPVDFQQNVWNNIRLVVNNGIAIGYINGIKCIEVNIKSNDTTFNVGYVGLVCYETVGSLWKNIKIIDLNNTIKSGSGAYRFDGTNQHIPNLKTPIPTEPYTYVMWAKPTINMGTTRRNLMVGSGPVWNPGLWANSTTLRGHSYNEYRTKTISWPINEWHMVGQIFDGTNTYLIWDGDISLDTRTTYSPPNNSNLYIGAETATGNAYNWVGDIDDVRIYATALSATDVLELYQTKTQLDNTGNLFLNEVSHDFPKSAYEIQQRNPTAPSGFYGIQPDINSEPILAYCDMDTDGGGWTLLVCSQSNLAGQWDATTILSKNQELPSITSDYSILAYGDSIKSNIGGKLQYRIDAEAFGTWGGVWEAPITNTFTAYDMVQPLATNLRQYSSWTITGTGSSSSLSNRMPWMQPTSNTVLSTWNNTGSWWGTLVTNNTAYNPAPYISSQKPNPGIIWYWVK